MILDWQESRMEEEELPTFRPFTREELNTIENRIFENKLAAKKKQETRDKNIAVRKNHYYEYSFTRIRPSSSRGAE